jgi:hypothetical protein
MTMGKVLSLTLPGVCRAQSGLWEMPFHFTVGLWFRKSELKEIWTEIVTAQTYYYHALTDSDERSIYKNT